MSGRSEPQPDVSLRLCSDPRYLSGARELVMAVSRRLGFDEKAGNQIALAVDEALANVIRHGYSNERDRPIWMSLWPLVDNGEVTGLRIAIEDEARQVEPECIKGRDLADVRPGGLGVHIIRQVMDVATYEKRQGAGMRLVMEKRLATSENQGDNGTEADV